MTISRSSTGAAAGKPRPVAKQVTWEGASPLGDVCRTTEHNGGSVSCPLEAPADTAGRTTHRTACNAAAWLREAKNTPRLYGVPPQRVKARI